MSEFVQRKICEGVTFGSITDDRFKIGRLSATLLVPLSRQTAAANALLSCVLTRSCRKYPDFTSLSRKLNSLYGAALYPSVRQMGDCQALTIAVSGLDDIYTLDGEAISAELADLLSSIIFDPNVNDGLFSEEDIEQERRQLIESIDSEYNDKRYYAIKRCIESMCSDELYSIGRFGSRQDVESLTNADVYSAWKRLLSEARVELTMLGSASPDKAYEGFSEYFGDKPRMITELVHMDIIPGEVKYVSENQELSQSKLVMGFRCNFDEDDRAALENSLMSAVLGGTPTSKLFINVREKQSLCYYCVSRVDNNKGILLIDSGVETENIEKTKDAVLEQLELLKKGDISDEELINAKLAVKNSLMSSLDSLAALQNFYIGGIMRKNQLTPARAAEFTDGIPKERIIELANKVQLDTVFTLKGN